MFFDCSCEPEIIISFASILQTLLYNNAQHILLNTDLIKLHIVIVARRQNWNRVLHS